MKKLTRREAIEGGVMYYFTGDECKNGHTSKRRTTSRDCYSCALQRSKTWRNGNKDYHKKYNHDYHLEHKEEEAQRTKKYYDNMRKNHTEILHKRQAKNSRKYIRSHKTEHNARNKVYRQNNKGIINAKTAKRRARKLNATPHWAKLDIIKQIYIECQEINTINKMCGGSGKFVVDHIIPLQGNTVCGLHVDNNLNIITENENNIKFNKFNSEEF